MEDALSLKDVLGVYRRRFWIVVAVMLVCVVLAVMLGYVLLPSVYRSETSLIVNQRQTDQTAGGIDYSQVQTNRTLAVTYAEIITSRVILQDTINRLKLDMTVDNLAKATTVQVKGQTEIIVVSVTNTDAQRAALLANAVAASFMMQLPKLVNSVERVSVIDPAVASTKQVSPRPLLLIAVAFAVGLILGTLAAFLADYFDDTVRTKDDVKQLFGLRVLTVVPDMRTKGGRHERAG